MKGRPTLEALAPALEWDPAPVALPGWQRLKEGAAAAQAWRDRVEALVASTAPAQLSALELLSSEAARLPVHMTEAKVSGSAS